MAKRRHRRRGRIGLDPQRRGYFLDGELRPGFADNPELSPRERLAVARWAEGFTPGALSPEQRQLLAEAPPPSVSLRHIEASQNNRDLQSRYMMVLYDSLTEEERLIVHDPSYSPNLPDVDYPLSVGEIATITEATERKIRNWANEDLLPYFRQGNDRRFYSAALIRAFVLQRTPTHIKAVAAATAQGKAAPAFQLLAATVGRAALRLPPKSAEQLTRLADELSSASRLMVDGWPSPDAASVPAQKEGGPRFRDPPLGR